mmetsp:Transcript_62062/g.189536  ORF Transcript_62062/g.189536 Transcript_62062/m.189536 type:complete len:412 (+) Transcript_62062:224-1459(+)
MRTLLASRSRLFPDSTTFSTNMATITLKRPNVINTDIMLKIAPQPQPYCSVMRTRSGRPPASPHSPTTTQRKTVKNERGTESKYLAPWPLSGILPRPSLNTKHTEYTGKTMMNIDHKSVLMPPIMPWTMSLSSLKISSRMTRSTRSTRKSRIVLSKGISCASPLSLSGFPCCANAKPNSMTASRTSAASNRLVSLSEPLTKTMGPSSLSFTSSSTKKIAANIPSVTIHPNPSGSTSVLMPSTAAFKMITTPMNESIANNARCLQAALAAVAASLSICSPTCVIASDLRRTNSSPFDFETGDVMPLPSEASSRDLVEAAPGESWNSNAGSCWPSFSCAGSGSPVPSARGRAGAASAPSAASLALTSRSEISCWRLANPAACASASRRKAAAKPSVDWTPKTRASPLPGGVLL